MLSGAVGGFSPRTRRRSIRLAAASWRSWEGVSGSVLGRPSVGGLRLGSSGRSFTLVLLPFWQVVVWCQAWRFRGSLPRRVRAAATAARTRRLAWKATGRTGITKSPSSWTTSPPKPFLNS
ncbi:hypothetical protein AHiyo4_08560 [Arthrobacter sp. Hiyo4]|nr:hypothetical protein AHiyo4_08560 [Arthrobacter sp. Hiyo4]